MATEQLSLKIIVDSTNYYLSDNEYLGTDAIFYFGVILDAPVVELAPTRGGFSSFKTGTIVLENRPLDSNHPFGAGRYSLLIESPETNYIFTLKLSTLSYDWITGVLVIGKISEETLTFTLYSDSYPYSPVSEVENIDGFDVTAPWCYGAITNFDDLIKTGATTFQNPLGLTSGITFFEDGVSKSTSLSTSTITCGSYGGGQAVISSSTTKTLGNFFDFVANSLELDVSDANTDKSASAAALDIKIRETNPVSLVEIASNVSEGYNCIFFIAIDPDNENKKTLFLVDRANVPETFTTIAEDIIINSSFSLGFPLGSMNSEIDIVKIEGGKITKYAEKIRIKNEEEAKNVSVKAYADTYADRDRIVDILNAIQTIEIKSKASVTVPGLHPEFRLGDRYKFGRDISYIDADMIARSIVFDFKQRQTTLSGDANLSIYTRSF